PTLDTVHPEDRLAVVRAWERAHHRGVAQVSVRRLDGTVISVYFVDLTDTEGVMLLAVVPAESASPVAPPAEPLPPRVCTMRRDQQSIIVDVDASGEVILGWKREDLVGQSSLKFIYPDDADRGIANWLEMLSASDRPHRWRGRYQ